MAQGWEGTSRSASLLQRAGMGGAILLAVLVVGFLARPDGRGPGGGALEVRDAEPGEATAAPSGPAVTRPEPRPTPTPEPGDQLEGALIGQWATQEVPSSLDPMHAAVAWDGARRLLVFGGERPGVDDSRVEHLGEAWLYDLVDHGWRQLPPSPLTPRSGAAAAWTGNEFIVWGGIGPTSIFADGAAYDPDDDRWRELAPAPLSPRHGAAAVRTAAGEVLIMGGRDNASGHADGARYDPVADAWTVAPPLPWALSRWGAPAAALAAGEEVLVWLPEPWEPEGTPPLRLAGDEWSPIAPSATPDSSLTPQAVGTGPVLGVRSRWGDSGHLEGELVRLAPDGAAWRVLTEVPFTAHEPFVTVAMAERYLVVLELAGGRAAAYDTVEARWLDLPSPAYGGGHVPALRTFETPDGFLLFGPGLPGWELRRFVLDGEARP